MIHDKKKLYKTFSEGHLKYLLTGVVSVSLFSSLLVFAVSRLWPWSPAAGILFCFLVLSIAAAAAAILTGRWIERPFQLFMKDAYEIGRGNFSVRLPEQKAAMLQRLAKLINYMAGEMDRLRKVNVHSIITEKNKTEALLRNIADGVIVTDVHSNVLVINHMAEKWFGMTEREVLGKPLKSSFRNAEMLKVFEKAIREPNDRTTEFAYQIMDAAVPHILQAHTSRVEDENGRPIGCIAILRDVTREREADRVKTELVSMVAHELKSPLTSIFGFSELLTQAEHTDPQFREYARVIMSESTRLTEFVNKFLDLSRLESGRTEVRKTPFDLKQVILHMIEMHRYILDSKHIHVITDFPEGMRLALGDQKLIEQVLTNLFVNAVKYSSDHSKIGIEIKNDFNIHYPFY